MEDKIYFKKLSEDAISPSKKNSSDAWYDFYSIEDYVLKPWDRHLFMTKIIVHLPLWTYGRIAPRSGLAYKNGIDVLAGVIDSDYRWEIGVLLVNHWDKDVLFSKGERIAQFIITRCFDLPWVESDTLKASARNEKWFWSTWKF